MKHGILLPWIACLILPHAFADMMKDSPVTFPEQGALPAKYPPDQPSKEHETPEEGYYIFSSPDRSPAQIEKIQAEMPKGEFTPPEPDWTHLSRSRRMLTEGGELRLLAMGDSIVNDTMRSGWVAKLQEVYPKANIQATVYVRGGGGCQHYKEEGRLAKHVVPRKPNLVFIGGISQRDIESIRVVIRELRAALRDVEILLATGTFGTADPRVPEELAKAAHSGTGAYGQSLKNLAAEERCAYLDMTTPWAEYIRFAGVHPHRFYRDPVHANEYGEQILSKILIAFFHPESHDGQTASVGTGGMTTVRPAEIDDPLVNPYSGWGIWVGPRFFDGREFSVAYNTTGFGDDAPLFSWVLLDWMWSDLEPEEGDFHWEDLDAVLRYWGDRGKQFLVRLWVTSDPGWAGAPGNKACSDWLWDAGVVYHKYTTREGNVLKRQPDYCDPSYERVYLPKLRAFLKAYRERYHQPEISIIMDQVMGYGDWGEWHVMWSHYKWPSREKKREVLTKIIHTYVDLLAPGHSEGTPLPQLSIAQVYDDDCPGNTLLEEAMWRQALDVAVKKGFSLSRHGFIDGLFGWPRDLMAKYWRSNPLIGEANWSYEQIKNDGNHGTMPQFVDAFVQWHSAYAHTYLHADSYRRAMKEDRAEFERALKPGGIGYRFVPLSLTWRRQIAAGSLFSLRQEWVNRNAAWCSYPFRLRIYLTDSGGRKHFAATDENFDPRGCIQGQVYHIASIFSFPRELTPGSYDLWVSLVDETNRPRVRLGIEGEDSQLKHRVGTVEVLNPSVINEGDESRRISSNPSLQ